MKTGVQVRIRVQVRQVALTVMFRVSTQEINVSLCDLSKSDGNTTVSVCVTDTENMKHAKASD